MIFNIVNGKPKVGTITVNCPTGTVVTCVQSPYTLSATSVSNKCTFVVPKSGTWAITGTLSGLTRTATAAISAYNGTASVTLVFTTYLYNSGKTVAWTIYRSTDNTTYIRIPANNGIMHTTSTVDLTNYSTLVVQSQADNNMTTGWVFGYDDSVNGNVKTLDGQAYIGNSYGSLHLWTYSISSVTGSKYIYVQSAVISGGGPSNMDIYQVYLE